MKSRYLRPQPLALAIAGLVVSAGLSFNNPAIGSVIIDESGHGYSASTAVVDHSISAKYIVRFKELPLALYNGGVPGLASIPHLSEPGRRPRLDTQGVQAQAYVNYLSGQQAQHLTDINSLLGRSVVAEHQMRYALNAAVITMTGDEAKKVAVLDSVEAVERDEYRQLMTDIGPGFIGAASIWWGTHAGQDTLFATGFDAQGYRGEGVVVADIDTGYNSNSPSFADVDDSGFAFTNPLGQGNYLGLCNPSNAEQPSTLFTVPFAGCNNKVIGAYDFIDTPPPSAGPFSAEDYQGHGSHTGSTAAGNTRNATIGAYSARISGVAPHANMVIYYACSLAGCPVSATAGAVDQAIQDSVIDSLNYSISGGANPWTDSTSLAFLSAADSGIFVAAAAGNTSTTVPNQVPGTANHLEPWVTTVAAGNHTGGPLGYFLTASGAGAPAPTGMNTAPGSTQPSAVIATTLALSPNFAAASDCAAFPAGTFTGKLAIMHYTGACGTNAMAGNAKTAGAAQVLLVDFSDDYINSGAVQTIPVFTTTSVQGNALAAYVTANPGVAGNVSYPANTRLPVAVDALANYSLLGPGTIDVIKPDVQAPGSAILAAFNNANPPTGSPPVAVPPSGAATVAFDDGTSMATPHTTGSGALLLGLHPDWTPLEVKSALMMTAKEAGLNKADHTTPSDFFDRGSGRIQDDVAAAAGLVLNETGLNFLNANPAKGGDPKTLNIASMQNRNCVTVTGPTASSSTCSFLRRLRSTQDHTVTWTASFSGVTATASPSSFPVVAHGTAAVHINVDASAYASNGTYHFGELILTPSDASLTPLHLPIAVGLQPPAISAAPSPMAISIPVGNTTNAGTLTVTNTGGPTLNVTKTNDNTGSVVGVVIDQPSQGSFGFFSDFWTDVGDGAFPADDFVISIPGTNLSKLSFPGFVLSGGNLSTLTGQKIHFEIYSDNAGIPNGNPETVAASYVWNYVATIGTTAGLTLTGNTIAINLGTAGATPTNLAPGKYWMVVYKTTPTIGAGTPNGWLWFESTAANGSDAQNIDPGLIFQGATGNWTDNTSSGDFPGMAMHIEQIGTCGAPWLSTSPATLTLGGLLSGAVTVTVDSTLFPVGATSSAAFLCLDSNDALHPVYAVPITAKQN